MLVFTFEVCSHNKFFYSVAFEQERTVCVSPFSSELFLSFYENRHLNYLTEKKCAQASKLTMRNCCYKSIILNFKNSFVVLPKDGVVGKFLQI